MKTFALPDTFPAPCFTIDAAQSEVTVKTGCRSDGRMMVEIWRDRILLSRVFARTVKIADLKTDSQERQE